MTEISILITVCDQDVDTRLFYSTMVGEQKSFSFVQLISESGSRHFLHSWLNEMYHWLVTTLSERSKLKSWLKTINCAALHINYSNCPPLVSWGQCKLCCLPVSSLVRWSISEINWSHCVHSEPLPSSFSSQWLKLHWQHWVGSSL